MTLPQQIRRGTNKVEFACKLAATVLGAFVIMLAFLGWVP